MSKVKIKTVRPEKKSKPFALRSARRARLEGAPYPAAFSCSFEFFPPKTQEGWTHFTETVAHLSETCPNFFSVTFGAGGSTRAGTLQAVQLLQSNTNITVAPHITCLGCEREELIELLMLYKTLGIEHIVALRGDFPGEAMPAGEFKYASELVALIRKTLGDEVHIKVAAYPEGHPEVRDMRAEVANLKRKYEAGANSAITQYFFNSDAYFYYLTECEKQGVHLPIVPGIMPITNYQRLVRFSTLCGAEIPRWLRKRLESYGEDEAALLAFGIEFMHEFCERLIQGGAPGLHFYTLNKIDSTLPLVEKLGLHTKEVINIINMR
jgi:methylenetetrahydrofolate reductase (NADPH)